MLVMERHGPHVAAAGSTNRRYSPGREKTTINQVRRVVQRATPRAGRCMGLARCTGKGQGPACRNKHQPASRVLD